MKLGRIVGTVVSTRKDEKIESLKLYVVRDLSVSSDRATALTEKPSFVIAADTVGAGLGEVVLYASGSSARQTRMTDGKPVDASVMAIVDHIDLDGRAIYDKSRDEWTPGGEG
ncbi:MAG: ethanolamine utilization protein EutN [Deltaproteobacteria bacterium]|nr:MAG: ethanolamine utilization protein EutN [Deltaproteobacteria bacterium]